MPKTNHALPTPKANHLKGIPKWYISSYWSQENEKNMFSWQKVKSKTIHIYIAEKKQNLAFMKQKINVLTQNLCDLKQKIIDFVVGTHYLKIVFFKYAAVFFLNMKMQYFCQQLLWLPPPPPPRRNWKFFARKQRQ